MDRREPGEGGLGCPHVGGACEAVCRVNSAFRRTFVAKPVVLRSNCVRSSCKGFITLLVKQNYD